MQAAKTAWIAAAVGPKGSGKSFWVKQYLRKRKGIVLIFDGLGEYMPRGKEGIPGLRVHESMASFLAYVRRGGKIQKEAIGASRHSFEAFCRFAYEMGGALVVIEEVSRYTAQAKRSEAFINLCDRPRHRHLDVLTIAARPKSLPTEFRGQISEWIAFQTREPNDLKFWRETAGIDVARKLQNLKRYAHLKI